MFKNQLQDKSSQANSSVAENKSAFQKEKGLKTKLERKNLILKTFSNTYLPCFPPNHTIF